MDIENTKTKPTRETLLLFLNSVRRSVDDLDVEDSKLTEDHENRVRRHYNQLLSNINVPDVVTQMFQSGKLTAKEYEHIRQFYSTPIRASEELLNIVILNSRDVYECFLELLKKTKQHHVYQMLTSDEESVCVGEQSVSEHSRLIRQNYDWLTKKLDLDSGLLQTLYAKEVLSQREYGQILFERDQFLRNEMLLTIISRKSVEDFKKFTVVLNDTLQGHIAKRLTETPFGDANQNVTTMVIKTLPTVCTDTFEKRIPPKPPPKPKKQPPTLPSSKPMVIKPMPLPKPEIHSSKPNRIEKRQNATNLNIMKKRSVEYLEAKFRVLPNELQTEISTKIVLLHRKNSTDSIWKITLTKMLEESRNVKRQSLMQAKASDETCERLKQETIQRERECKIIKEDIEREKTKLQMQLRELQERLYELEYRRNLAENENIDMCAKLKKSEVEVEGLKTQNKHKDQEANEKKSIIKELKVQVKYSEIKLKETAAQLRDTTDNLTENDTALKESANKLEYYEKKFKEAETKLTEFEAKLILTEKGHDNLRYEDVKATLFDLKEKFKEERKVWEDEKVQLINKAQDLQLSDVHSKLLDLQQNLEEERTVWAEERIQLMKQARKLQNESMGSRAKCLALEQKLELERTQKDRLKEQTEEYKRIIDELQDKYKSDPVLVHTIKTNSNKTKKGDNWIRGLTILDNELFVVYGVSSEVEVYHSITCSLRCRWDVKELNDPRDIVSCKRNKCIYIFDYKGLLESKEILRVDPNGKLINYWSTGDDWGRGLSVADDSNIILTVSCKHKLNEYSPDGELIREIYLMSDAGICWPSHAIKVTSGDFLVSHGDYDDDDANRVCSVVDASAKLKKSFCGNRESNIRQMIRLVHLSVDLNGFVMAVDQQNSRVLLLNSDLKFKREIISNQKHRIRRPERILLDESNSRLFVVDNEPNYGRILIFDIKYFGEM